MFKFGQVQVSKKDFNKVYELTENISIDKIVISEGVVDDKSGVRYTIGYEKEPGKIIPLYMKTPKDCWSPGVSRYNENSPWKMGFQIEHCIWLGQYNSIAGRVEDLLQHPLTRGNAAGDWINPKLITWKNEIKTMFRGGWGDDVPYDIPCTARGVLKIGSVYQQGDRYYLQVFLKECRYKERVAAPKSLLSSDEDSD